MQRDIEKRCLQFAVIISKYTMKLKEQQQYEIASQLFRSWTSIGANITEAQSWSSKKDFINKANIALKEARETLYRLDLLKEGFDEDVETISNECEELIKILVTIIKNTKQNHDL